MGIRQFDHPNLANDWHCRICCTQADRPVTLVAIPGTEDDGIVEAEQIHVECYELVIRMSASSAESETR